MNLRRLRHWRPLAVTAGVMVTAALLQFANANPAVSQTLFLTSFQAASDPGMDPASPVWKDAATVQVPLTAQLGIYPTGGGSIPTVTAQSLHFGDKLYMRLEWADSTDDESTTRVQDFSDAVALEFPARSASTVPAICMGQADAGVNIWHWRADSQAGLKDPVMVYAGAHSDQDVSKDTIFYTARAAGNPYANPTGGPVQTLVSRTFGTLTPADVQDVAGNGARTANGWAVVFVRQYVGSGYDQATFTDGAKTDMAVAVWNGSEGDRNGRKSVSQFVTLRIAAGAMPGASESHQTELILAGVALVGIVALGVGIAAYGMREKGGS